MHNTPEIILASSSPYRKQLLARLRLTFSCINPDIDESRNPEESPPSLVKRLATEKCRAVAKYKGNSNTLIIGSDQIAACENNILAKPNTHENAVKQLTLCSGKQVTFYTSICLYDCSNSHHQVEVDQFSVCFRELSPQDIENYLKIEQPYDCAGSFKAEGLGISLFRKMQGDDPNSLIGLPLIKLVSLLRDKKIELYQMDI